MVRTGFTKEYNDPRWYILQASIVQTEWTCTRLVATEYNHNSWFAGVSGRYISAHVTTIRSYNVIPFRCHTWCPRVTPTQNWYVFTSSTAVTHVSSSFTGSPLTLGSEYRSPMISIATSHSGDPRFKSGCGD